jgi:hypothetical protein
MRLVVSVLAKFAIYCALGAVGIGLIIRGGPTRDGLGALVVLLAAWELVKLSALVLGLVRVGRVGRQT